MRGLAKYELKEYQAAVNNFKESLKIKETTPFAHDCYYHIGTAYCQMMKHEKAVAAFTKAIQANAEAEIPLYFQERGKTLQHLQQHEEAIRDFTKVIELEPDNSNAYFRRAFAYRAILKFDEAAQDFEMARSLDPDKVVNYKKLHEIAYFD